MFKKIFYFLFLFQTTIPYTQLRQPTIPAVQILTKQNDQSGQNKFCNSANGTSQFTCSLRNSFSLQQLTLGTTLLLYTDTSCGPVCTLNVDNATNGAGVGPTVTIVGSVTAKQPVWIFFNDTNWIVMQ
jgi:hypothetical protein